MNLQGADTGLVSCGKSHSSLAEDVCEVCHKRISGTQQADAAVQYD